MKKRSYKKNTHFYKKNTQKSIYEKKRIFYKKKTRKRIYEKTHSWKQRILKAGFSTSTKKDISLRRMFNFDTLNVIVVKLIDWWIKIVIENFSMGKTVFFFGRSPRQFFVIKLTKSSAYVFCVKPETFFQNQNYM